MTAALTALGVCAVAGLMVAGGMSVPIVAALLVCGSAAAFESLRRRWHQVRDDRESHR